MWNIFYAPLWTIELNPSLQEGSPAASQNDSLFYFAYKNCVKQSSVITQIDDVSVTTCDIPSDNRSREGTIAKLVAI